MASNTETYVFQQMFARPVDVVYQGPGADGTIDTIVLEEYLPDGTTQVVTNPCPTTGHIKVTTTFTSSVSVLSVSTEILPYGGGNISTATADATAGTISNFTPVKSDYISNISPAFSATTSLTFDLNYPAITAAHQDFELLFHYGLKLP